jgi:hypothetical protein
LRFDSIVVRSVEGERRFGRDELPLRVGTGGSCQLRLPGPGGEPVALLDLLDELPIVQPVGRDTSFQINNSPLDASRRLVDGDVLQYYGSEILISIGDGGVVIDVRLEDSAYVTKPPELQDAADRPQDESIAPTAFRRAAESERTPAGRSSEAPAADDSRWNVSAIWGDRIENRDLEVRRNVVVKGRR